MKIKSVKLGKVIELPAKFNISKEAYVNPIPGELPMIGIGTPSGKTQFDLTVLSQMRQCGLNIAENILSESSVGISLNNANAVGMKIMVRLPHPHIGNLWIPDPNYPGTYVLSRAMIEKIDPTNSMWTTFYASWINTVNAYYNHDSVGGWMLEDEPSLKDFWVLSQCKEKIQQELLSKNNAPHCLFFVNLLKTRVEESLLVPSWSGGMNNIPSSEMIGFKPITSYDGYVGQFEKLFVPNFYSFDAYPFSGPAIECDSETGAIAESKSGTLKNLKKNLQSFFLTLIYYNKIREEKGVGFWSTVQTCQETTTMSKTLMNGTVVTYQVPKFQDPSLGNIRFQAYCALAFGASGLSFWRFSDDISGSTTHSLAPIAKDGIRSITFDYLKQVLGDLYKYGHIFLNAVKVTPAVTKFIPDSGDMNSERGVIQATPGIKVLTTNSNNELTTPFSFLKSVVVETKGAIVVETKGAIVSEVLTSTTRYLIVVNLENNIRQKISLKFTEYVKDEMNSSLLPMLNDEKSSSDNNEKNYGCTCGSCEFLFF